MISGGKTEDDKRRKKYTHSLEEAERGAGMSQRTKRPYLQHLNVRSPVRERSCERSRRTKEGGVGVGRGDARLGSDGGERFDFEMGRVSRAHRSFLTYRSNS